MFSSFVLLLGWIVGSLSRLQATLGGFEILNLDLTMTYGGLEGLACFSEDQTFGLNVEIILDLADDFFSGMVPDEQVDDVLLVALPLFEKHVQRLGEDALR